jgi:hypothetical protein
MAPRAATVRANLHRDITEALLRLKLARAERDRALTKTCQQELDRLLDRLAKDLGIGDKE